MFGFLIIFRLISRSVLEYYLEKRVFCIEHVFSPEATSTLSMSTAKCVSFEFGN